MTNVSATRRRARLRRHRRLRKKISGSAERPRLAVFRSSRHISAQLIDDDAGKTLAAASSVEAELRDSSQSPVGAAAAVGRLLAERAGQAGIGAAVFDRGGFQYHGRVAAVAEAAREAGLEF